MLKGRATPIFVDALSSPLSVALRDESTVSIGVMNFLERRRSGGMIVASMALAFSVSANPPKTTDLLKNEV